MPQVYRTIALVPRHEMEEILADKGQVASRGEGRGSRVEGRGLEVEGGGPDGTAGALVAK